MKHPKYPVQVDDEHHIYEFYSEEGARGSIKKTIIYSQIEDNFFNLAFGDWDEKLKRLDDSSRTNNGDRDQVLATVAYTALDFTAKYPHSQFLVEGSTLARTRLYQMGIANNLLEIKQKLDIFGYLKEQREPFQRGRNYEAFLIQRK